MNHKRVRLRPYVLKKWQYNSWLTHVTLVTGLLCINLTLTFDQVQGLILIFFTRAISLLKLSCLRTFEFHFEHPSVFLFCFWKVYGRAFIIFLHYSGDKTFSVQFIYSEYQRYIGLHRWFHRYTLPSINNYTHTKFDMHFQDSLNLN